MCNVNRGVRGGSSRSCTLARWTCAAAVVLLGCDDDIDERFRRAPMDPMMIPKFVEPLVIPGVMPPTSESPEGTEYRIAVRQFQQQVLPRPMPMTTVWGYGRAGDPLPGSDVPSTFHYPGLTVETRSNEPVRVLWSNELVDDEGRFLPHIVPVDATIHWADPGHSDEPGTHDHGDENPLYTGPVPTVTHVHGAHSFDHSDGHPEAWYLPDATNLPPGFSAQGPRFRTQADVGAGAALFEYPQDEDAATLWYHDHSLGITRVNIYAGLLGYWLIRDEHEDSLNLPGPAPRLGDPEGTRYYEIPLVIQDKTFGENGELWYPSSRTQYDDYPGPFIPESEVPPIWGPEFIGNAIVVNGRTWPFHEVEPRLYRLRLLNGSDARTLIMQFDRAGIPFIQIGGDGGFRFDMPVEQASLILGPAERLDVLVDFSQLGVGDTVTLLNVGPDDPWGGPDADPPQDPADPETTGQIMQFRVAAPTGEGTPGRVPEVLPPAVPLEPTVPPRDLLLRELAVTQDSQDYPTHVLLGTVALGPLFWTDPTTEVIRLDDTEIWRVANTTDDAHPIHIHLIDFHILDRIPFDADGLRAAQDAFAAGTGPAPVLDDFITGPPMPIATIEQAPKDTVIMMPRTITRLIARFDRVGSYVWHCHIVEHEDNEMMRPLEIVPRTDGALAR